MKENKGALLSILAAMLIWGTLGLIRRHIPLPSSVICLSRGIIGSIFLYLLLVVKGKGLDMVAIKKNFKWLFFSGLLLGANWTLLFEAFKYTSVAVAILCFYMEPIILIIASPIVFKEKLTWKGGLCVLVAFLGMVLVSGVLDTGVQNWEEIKGAAFGLMAACFYASIVMINKKVDNIGAYDKTIVQLLGVIAAMLPFCLITVGAEEIQGNWLSWSLLVVLGSVHTGIALALFFGAANKLSAQTLALVSYFDPVSSVIFAAVFLGEKLDLVGYIGAALILGSTMVHERINS